MDKSTCYAGNVLFKISNIIGYFSALDLGEKEINEGEPIFCEEYRRVWKNSERDINQTHFQELSGKIKSIII